MKSKEKKRPSHHHQEVFDRGFVPLEKAEMTADILPWLLFDVIFWEGGDAEQNKFDFYHHSLFDRNNGSILHSSLSIFEIDIIIVTKISLKQFVRRSQFQNPSIF